MGRQVQITLCALALTALGCDGEDTTDAGTDAGRRDSGMVRNDGGFDGGPGDAAVPSDSAVPTDAGAPLPEPTVLSLATGHDRIFAITHDADGNVYATGQLSDATADADFELFVAKFTPAGVLVDSFGDDGIARVNVTEGGLAGEIAHGIVIQDSGRIVIAGTTEHDVTASGLLARDTDIVLVGFEPDGDLDPTFGVAPGGGIETFSLGTGYVGLNGMGVDALLSGDAQWGLALDSENRIVLHCAARAAGRDDTDWAVVRRLINGGVDADFGNAQGVVTFDIDNANASARTLSVLADDSILAFGYTTTDFLVRPTGSGTSQQPVIYKLTEDGEFDDSFATADAFSTVDGVWHDFATPAPERRNAEAYGGALLPGGGFITIGYGPTPVSGGTGTDLVSFRWSAAGVLDPTYATVGYVYVDVLMDADNGRFITRLPDGRTLSTGRGRRPAMGERDALVFVLSAEGVPDATFGTDGLRIYDLGADDEFWTASVFEPAVGDDVVVVGGIAAGDGAGADDDSALLFLPL